MSRFLLLLLSKFILSRLLLLRYINRSRYRIITLLLIIIIISSILKILLQLRKENLSQIRNLLKLIISKILSFLVIYQKSTRISFKKSQFLINLIDIANKKNITPSISIYKTIYLKVLNYINLYPISLRSLISSPLRLLIGYDFQHLISKEHQNYYSFGSGITYFR